MLLGIIIDSINETSLFTLICRIFLLC